MDQWRRFYLQANGPHFRPGAMGIQFLSSFEPGTVATFGGRRGQIVPFGGALYRVPDDLPYARSETQLEAAFAHLAALQPALRAAGVDKFVLHMHRTFEGQCNEEFTPSELRMLLSLDCPFFYAARTDWDDEV